MRLSTRCALPTFAALLALAGCHKQADTGAATSADTGAVAASGAASAPTGTAPAGGWVEQVVQTPEGGFLMGNPAAPAKLMEFGSRTCPHCGAFAKEAMPDIKQMVASGKLSYEFRDFPIHAPDLAAILLGQCNGPSGYFAILEGMMADQVNTLPKLETMPPTFTATLTGKTPNQQAAIWADYLGYTSFVGQRGVPQAKAQACLADPKAVDKIGAHMQSDSTKYNVTGTPTFVLNGDSIGTMEWETLKPKLIAAGA